MNERISVVDTRGIAATDYESTLKAADFDWEPLADKVQGATVGCIMPRKKILYRSDNKTALGVVGEDYTASNPREFLKTQFELATQLGGRVVRAGWTERRSKAFVCVRLTQDLMLPKNVRKTGDPIGVYIYSTDGWDGGTPRLSRMYMERLACTNGMVTRELSDSLWVPHTLNLEDRYVLAWDQFKREVDTQITSAREQFTQLAKARMSDEDMRAFVGKLIPGEGSAAENRREQINKLFHEGIGLQGNSRYDALNAVTEYVTHYATYRDTKIASAETSRFLGVVGGRNMMVERAMNLLLEH